MDLYHKGKIMWGKKHDEREELYTYVKNHFWRSRNSSAHTLSTTCRQLALGEGGICWLVKASTYCSLGSSQANFVLILLVVFFIFDATQYLISYIRYSDIAEEYDGKILNYKIKKIEELKEPKNINRAPMVCFILKLFTLLLASLLLVYLLLRL